MSDQDTTTPTIERRWVAFGPIGAVGSIQQDADGFHVRLMDDADGRASFPTLDVAKSALIAALPAGAERPEFREH